jgi:phosphohistidine phosphatase
MELYVLRHAIAVARGTPGYDDDSQRPLTPEGEKKMRKVARGMRKIGLEFDFILSSPYVRARRTAEIVAAEFDAKDKLRFSENLISEGDPSLMIDEINGLGLARILIVGHEPYLSKALSVLLSGRDDVAMHFKKGGLCRLSAEKLSYGQCATLEWLLTPRQMIGIGE